MRVSDPLNDRQLEVLFWIAEGCPDGVMQGYMYKSSAKALQDRKLVKVSRAAGTWSAAMTDAGRHYIEHGSYPAGGAALAPARVSGKRTRSASQKGKQASATTQPSTAVVSPAVLLQRLTDGEGSVVIADPPPAVRAAWRRAISETRRCGHVPAGRHLAHQGRDHGDLIIELQDGPPPHQARRAERRVLAVPDEIARLHPLLANLADPATDLRVSTGAASRALRLLHVLFTAAEQDGCIVEWARTPGGAVAFRRDEQRVLARLSEEEEEQDLLPDVDAQASGKRYDWQRVQLERRVVGSGRLQLALDDDWTFRGRRRQWADRKRWRLEDRLGDALDEIIHRLSELTERQRAKERAEIERQQDWDRAMASARAAFAEDRRIKALDTQLAAWRKAKQVRAYCDELAQLDDADAERQAWIAWARQYADQLDPCGRLDHAPREVEPRPEDLHPFLRGWSPYGPERR